MRCPSLSKLILRVPLALFLTGSAFGQDPPCMEPTLEDPTSGETVLVTVLPAMPLDDWYYHEEGDGTWLNPKVETTGDGFSRTREKYRGRSFQGDGRDASGAGDVIYNSEDERMTIALTNSSVQANAPEAFWVKMDVSGYHLKYDSTDTYSSDAVFQLAWRSRALQEMEDYYLYAGKRRHVASAGTCGNSHNWR
ncbi:MAG: hypothetical protein H8E66_27250 [Planctomycetes bacterium]|nr:hypothetical protein [Planctomycetota bacterium]